MIEATDLNLITYVIRIKPHVKICKSSNLDANGIYYYAIEPEKGQANYLCTLGKKIPITMDIALAEIYHSGADAGHQSKFLTWQEATHCTVHPVSRKIFFEATLKGLR
jgi:hypothetical protein